VGGSSGTDIVKPASRSSGARSSQGQNPNRPAKSLDGRRGTDVAAVAEIVRSMVDVCSEQLFGPLTRQTQVIPSPSAVASKNTAAHAVTAARSNRVNFMGTLR
jgi:hypothetical protein